MTRMRILLVCLLVCACAIPLRLAATSDPLLAGEPFSVPLPPGRELADQELLEVEGELAPVIILLFACLGAAVGAGGGMAVHENWFDEDYGIDGDDWGEIGGAAITAFTGGFVGGCTRSCASSVFSAGAI